MSQELTSEQKYKVIFANARMLLNRLQVGQLMPGEFNSHQQAVDLLSAFIGGDLNVAEKPKISEIRKDLPPEPEYVPPEPPLAP